MGTSAALQQNGAVTRLGKISCSSAITIAGLATCWAASVFVSAIEALVASQFFPGAWGEDGPTKITAKIALRVAGCVGLMVGGYVSAWFASRMQRSELKHALLVGSIYGVLGVLSDTQPMSWMLVSFVFLIAVSAAALGGWLREAQVRKYRTTVAVPRFR